MLDAKRLFDQFLGGQLGGHGGGGHSGSHGGAAGGFGGKSGGAFDPAQLGQLARQFGGRSLGGGTGGLGGGLGGLGGALGGVGGGALAGTLASVLMGSKHGRKLGGSALKMGGMAVVGALAYTAFQNWQAGQQPATVAAPADTPLLPPPTGTPFNPSSEAEQQSLGRGLLRAMIAAAKADGHVDATEQANIFAEMDKLDLDSEGKAFIMDELRAPLDVDAVAREAKTPEQAAEIYAASLLAIDVDNAAERGYLALLAARMNLDDGLVAHLHATIEGATEPA